MSLATNPYDAVHLIPKVLTEKFDQTFVFRRRAVASTDVDCIGAMSRASERLCLALNDFKPYLNQQRISFVEIKLRSIANAIGKIRNQDMAIVALEKVVLQTHPDISKAVKHLIANRKQVRRRSSTALKLLLVSLRPSELRADLVCSVSPESGADLGPVKIAKPFKSIAGAIIRKRLTEFEEYGNQLRNSSQAVRLNELNTVTKQLIFAIELLGNFSNSDLELFSRSLSALENALMELAECNACIADLRAEIVASIKQHRPDSTRNL